MPQRHIELPEQQKACLDFGPAYANAIGQSLVHASEYLK